jgi:hypothetical protein
LHHPQNQRLTLEISAAGSAESNQITLSLNSQALNTFEVGSSVSSHQMTLPPLAEELVKLELSAAEPSQPISILRLALQPGDDE